MKRRPSRYEFQTIDKIVKLYCASTHKKARLCPDCEDLLNYAIKKLEHCPYGENKPACSRCSVHCYKDIYRLQVKKIMRSIGLKFFLLHPLLAIRHIFQLVKS